jgi:hypothetical protein
VAVDSHWSNWHRAYEDPASSLSRRLAVVQRRFGEAVSAAPAGPVTVISMCAGQGRDVIGVLSDHPRRDDVRARLVELDPVLAADARAAARASGLSDVEVVQGDASTTSAYEGLVPADVIMACGVFGNITPDDIRTTVLALPQLAAPGAVAIWTRHTRPPDLTPSIRAWFAEAGFAEVAFDTEDGRSFSVGVARLVADPLPFRPGQTLFEFRGGGADACF